MLKWLLCGMANDVFAQLSCGSAQWRHSVRCGVLS